MAESKHIMAQESFWGSIITYIGVSLGFLTTFFILAKYLSPEEVGLTRLLVELATLLSGLGMLGLSTSISRYYPYFHTEARGESEVPDRGFFHWLLRLLSVGLPLAVVLYFWGADVLNPLFGKGNALLKDYYLAIVPLCVFIAVWTVAELYAVQLMRLMIPRLIRELLLRCLLLVSYLIYAWGWVSLGGFVAVFVGAYGLCMLLALLYLGRITPLSLKRDKDFPDRAMQRSMLRYTLLSTLSVVGTTLAGRMDLFMLAFIPSAGLRSAAVFSIGFFMVSIVEIPTRSIIALSTARIAQLMKEQKLHEVKRTYEMVSRYQLLTSLLIYLSIYISIEALISLMPRATDYAGSAEVFLILGAGKLIEVAFTASHPIINSSKHYHWSLYYTLWCIVAAFVANYYLIPLWDARGAALATVLTSVVGYALLQVVLYSKFRLTNISWAMARLTLMGVGLFALGAYLPHYDNVYLSISLRSGLMLLLGLIATYALRLAPEAEALLWAKVKTFRHSNSLTKDI